MLQATVHYADGHGPDKSEQAQTASVEGLAIVGETDLSSDENNPGVVYTYTLSDATVPVGWSLGGPDATRLTVDAAGGLRFAPAPNFEEPTDAGHATDEDHNNVYHVTVQATPTAGASSSSSSFSALLAAFGSLSDDPAPASDAAASSSTLTKEVVVVVSNDDEDGVVLLPSGSPRVGAPLTARLKDADGVLPGTAQWTWSGQASGPGTDLDGASKSRYEPTGEDVGQVLQVQVDYEDVFGPKTVASDPTAAVQPAGVVTLTPAQPRVGTPVTAQLSGAEAAVTGATWSWWRREHDTDDWELVGSSSSDVVPSAFSNMFSSFNWGSAEVSSYQPKVRDIDYVLRATVSWDGGLENVIGGITGPSANQAASSMSASGIVAYVTTVLVPNSWLGQTVYAFAQYDDSCGDRKSASTTSQPMVATAKPVVSLAPPPVSKLTAQAAPNPSNPTTALHVQVPVSGRVELTVYNMAGQIVRTLVDGSLEAGYHTFFWDGRDEMGYPVTSGVYLYRGRTDQQVVVGKMALIR